MCQHNMCISLNSAKMTHIRWKGRFSRIYFLFLENPIYCNFLENWPVNFFKKLFNDSPLYYQWSEGKKSRGHQIGKKSANCCITPPPIPFFCFFFFTENCLWIAILGFKLLIHFFFRFSKTVLCYIINGNEPIKH